MVFYAAFNSISVISRRLLTLFMPFLCFTSTTLGSEVSCPRTLPRKNPEEPGRLEPRTPGLQVKYFTTLVLKKGFYHKEYLCEIYKLYRLPFKSYGNCKVFEDNQTDRRADERTNSQTKNYMPPYFIQGHKKMCLSFILSCSDDIFIISAMLCGKGA